MRQAGSCVLPPSSFIVFWRSAMFEFEVRWWGVGSAARLHPNCATRSARLWRHRRLTRHAACGVGVSAPEENTIQEKRGKLGG